jgi:hypothetical protein
VLGQSALAAGIEVAEQIESLQQLGCGRRGMEFKIREQAGANLRRLLYRSASSER